MEDNYELEAGGVKFDQDKPAMDLVPYDALFEIAMVFAHGAKKYDSWNWAKGMRWGRMAAAGMRHIGLWLLGEDNDKETGRSHIAHAGCCMLMLLGSILRKVGEDDRFKVYNDGAKLPF